MPVAGFSAADICMPNTTAQFKNESKIAQGNIQSYNWNFGDGASGAANIDSIANPSHQYTGYGKYLVTLKVISNSGCTNTVSKLYSGIHLQPVAKFVSDHPAGVCTKEEIIFTDNSTGDDGTITSWIWNAGDGSAPVSFDNANNHFRHTYSQPGSYSITLAVKNDYGCENQVTAPATVFALPEVNAGPDQFVHEGRSATLFGTASPDVTSIRWTPSTYLSDPNSLKPSVNFPTTDVIYTINVVNDKGCKASDNTVVKLLKPLQIPNVFSPNGDAINDVWNIRYLADYPGCIVDIFDRYGKQVFHSVGYNKPWDGTMSGRPVPVGVYYYIITPKNETPTINGSVTVLR
jgi:gliding motility-associated-like protein